MMGTLPVKLRGLTSLTSLTLANSVFEGTIPSDLRLLSNLLAIYLIDNFFISTNE
jgi:hypothetical protein